MSSTNGIVHGFFDIFCNGPLRSAQHLATAAYSGKGSGETTLLRQLKSTLRPGDILVADSYYCTYWLVSMCQQIGVEVVMKNHHKRDDDPIGATRLSEHERTIVGLGRHAQHGWANVNTARFQKH